MPAEYSATLPRPTELTSGDIKTAKDRMRVRLQQHRASLLEKPDSHQAGLRLRESFLDRCPLPPSLCIAGYWPLQDEIDVRPLLNALADRGHPMAMPVVLNRQQPMRFRRWFPGMVMESGRFGIPTPPDSFPEIKPDVVLLPLLAFDKLGYRLGRGSGYYDHTLALLRSKGRVLAMGMAYAGQEVPAVPHDVLDQRIDWVVTEHYASPTAAAANPLAAFGALR